MVFSYRLVSLLNPQLWLEESYEVGSVLPSRSFPGIGLFIFSDTKHGVRGPCVVRDSWIFLKKFFDPKMGKMYQK